MGSQLVEAYITDNTPKAQAAQLNGLLTSYCLATKVGHFARALLPSVVVPDHLRLGKIQLEVHGAPTNSLVATCPLPSALSQRAHVPALRKPWSMRRHCSTEGPLRPSSTPLLSARRHRAGTFLWRKAAR